MTATRRRTRRGAAAVETAIVLPVLFLVLIGLIVGGTSVFFHQQVACQAREAARFAAARGGDYQKDLDRPSPTRQQIIDQAVLPFAAGMDPAGVAVQVQWVDRGTNATAEWDAAPKDVRSVNPAGETVTNSVRVTVRYSWSVPLAAEPVVFESVCEVPMSY